MLPFGLFLAGLIHVFISRGAVPKRLNQDSLKSVLLSAAFGVSIALCSCPVVFVMAEMRRKGPAQRDRAFCLHVVPDHGARIRGRFNPGHRRVLRSDCGCRSAGDQL